MNPNDRTARVVGALFLASNITFLLGAVVFIEPILAAPDFLTLASTNRTEVVLGVLLELLNGIAYLGIAVLIYPILKSRFESLALGYVGFRMIEFIMQVLTDLSPLSLLTLSEEFARAGTPEAASLQTLGTLLVAERAWAFVMLSIVFSLSALIFYYMLYHTRLIPRFISIWGLIGATVVLVNTLFDMLGVTLPNLGVIMLLNELFLGIWLIVRGFNPDALLSREATDARHSPVTVSR